MLEYVVIFALLAVPAIVLATWLRRRNLYAALSTRVEGVKAATLQGLNTLVFLPRPDFAQRLATVEAFLPAPALAAVTADAERLVAPERSYIPTHKKGGTVAYETIIANAPALVELYQSQELREFVSRLVGEQVQPTPLHDQSSLSVLFYDKPGDHIGWHFDHNFYRGRHFTVLLPVVNRGSGENGLSHARLTAMVNGAELDIATPPNKLIVFEGARVRHKVAPIIEGERRMVVSMTFCADPREGHVDRARGVALGELRLGADVDVGVSVGLHLVECLLR